MSLCNYNKTDEKKEGGQTRTSLGSGFSLKTQTAKPKPVRVQQFKLENQNEKLDHSSLCLLRCSETLIGTTLVMFLLRTSLMNFD